MAKNTRERAERYKTERDKRPTASSSYIRISPSKVRIVLDMVRGKRYEDAVVILSNTNKSACPIVLKVINSAASNAENNQSIPKESLYIAECWVGQGPTLKRLMPRAKGRADRILKRTSHITVILDEKVEEKVAPKPKATKAPAKGAAVKKETTTKKDAPKVERGGAENPIAKEPNAKKPLGTKKEATPAGKTATAKPAAKPAAKKEEAK